MNGDDIRAAARECERVLGPAVDRDWSIPIPEMKWTVAMAVAHAAQTCIWYAFDLSARGAELETVQPEVATNASPADLLATVGATSSMLAAVVDAAPPTARGYHPFGLADPSGFAAMACDELLVHSDDAARGLGLRFSPDRELCARTLHRLFPVAPTDADSWDALRWANGRIALRDRPRRDRWKWHCAPLPPGEG